MHDEPPQKFQARSTFSTWVGVVLLFAFFAIFALVVIGASPRGSTYEKKRAKARAEKLRTAQSEMMTALTTYGWVDKAKGVAHIPVTEAMKLTVAELAQKKPATANPIATPEAQTPPPATSSSPAASPTPTPSTTPKPATITGPNSESHNQPAAAINPPPAPPKTQPGASSTPAATPPSTPAKPQASPSPSAKSSPSAPASPLPVPGKTP
jgi:hypothetical protein